MSSLFKRKQKACIIGFIGLILCILGVVIGTQILVLTSSKVEDALCVNSVTHSGYDKWIGDVSDRKVSYQMKITYFNITNVDGLLYHGEIPELQSVGPYIYRFASQKVGVTFTQTTVKYKVMTQTEYDEDLTRLKCPACREDDVLNVLNVAYVAAMVLYGGDTTFALGSIPSLMASVLENSDNITGSRSMTLEYLGNLNKKIFPSDFFMFPSGWVPNFSSITNSNHTVAEMNGLYTVLLNSTLLGVGAPPPSICSTDPISNSCVNIGFIPQVQALQKRKEALLELSQIVTNDPIIMELMLRINTLFCPDKLTQCLYMMNNLSMISYVENYVTSHLVKLVMYFVIDRNNYGLVTSRTQKELTQGYLMEHLKIPGFPDGFPAQGSLPNHLTEDIAKASKQEEEYYLCGIDGKKPFGWASYGGNSITPESYFPGASEEFRQIENQYSRTIFDIKTTIPPCSFEQRTVKDSYIYYETFHNTKLKLNRVGSHKIEGVHVEKFSFDYSYMYSVNNISVFKRGLVDQTNARGGVPVLLSQPELLNADAESITKLKMSPSSSDHDSSFMVEPISGAIISINFKLQFNSAIPRLVISAARAVPLNISYFDISSPYINPFPVFWSEVSVEPTADQLSILTKLGPILKGCCAAIILGPLLATIAFIIAIYIFMKAVKSGASIHIVK